MRNISNSLYVNVTLMKTSYDAVRELSTIATVSGAENVLTIQPSLPVQTLRTFIVPAKARQSEPNFATSAHGGSTHLAPELLNMVAGIKTTQIPYEGSGPALFYPLAGLVQCMMAIPINIMSHVCSGRLRAITLTGDKRLASVPDVSSIAIAGYPTISLSTWQAYGAPAGTRQAINEKISADIEKLVATPETRTLIEEQSMSSFFNGSEQTVLLLKSDIAWFAKIIKAANIKPEHGG